MFGNHYRGKAPTYIEIALHLHIARGALRYQVIQNTICDRLIKDSLLAKSIEVVFQGFEFQALFVRDIVYSYGGKVGKPCFRADRGKLSASMHNPIVALWAGVWESLQQSKLLFLGNRLANGSPLLSTFKRNT